jgi:hypothetical protein
MERAYCNAPTDKEAAIAFAWEAGIYIGAAESQSIARNKGDKHTASASSNDNDAHNNNDGNNDNSEADKRSLTVMKQGIATGLLDDSGKDNSKKGVGGLFDSSSDEDNDNGGKGLSGKEGKKRLGKARKVISEKEAKPRGPLDDTSSNNDDWSGAAKFLGNARKKRDKIVAPAAKDDTHDNWNNKDSDTTKPIAASQAKGVAQRTRVESIKDNNDDSHDDYNGNNNDNKVNLQSLIAAGQGKATGISDYSGENSGYGNEKSAKGTIKNDTCSRKEQLEALLRNHGERVRANFGSAAAVECVCVFLASGYD